MTKIQTEETADTTPELDFDAHYSVKGYRGIAWYLWGYKIEKVPVICYGEDEDGDEIEVEDWSETEDVEDRSKVIATMVGDDRKFTFDVEDVELLDEDDFCHVCGQIGCGHDGRERN